MIIAAELINVQPVVHSTGESCNAETTVISVYFYNGIIEFGIGFMGAYRYTIRLAMRGNEASIYIYIYRVPHRTLQDRVRR